MPENGFFVTDVPQNGSKMIFIVASFYVILGITKDLGVGEAIIFPPL
jgi:hypothetical protein